MKQLILIAAMLMSMTAKLVAQENKGIEVNHFQKQNTELQKENHQSISLIKTITITSFNQKSKIELVIRKN